MKTLHLFFSLCLAIVLWSCASEPTGTLIEVDLENANGLTANLDRIVLNGPSEMLKNTTIGEDGEFEFEFDKPLTPALYQIRVGAQKAVFALEEGDQFVKIDGDLSTFSNYEFTVEGSESAAEIVNTLKNLRQESRSIEDIQATVENAKNPQTGAFIAYNTLARAGEVGLPVHKAAIERLAEDDPNRESYGTFVSQMEQQLAMMRSQENIKVGQPAPNIELKSPDGKTYSLEDLKGQVVLLDFWASWCGPCRRENPNVVKVYNKYKDEGFTIYSVSLDGLDGRRTQGMSEDQIIAANQSHVNRWVSAIEKDGLIWDYHVSELKKWDGEVSAAYGVRGIPKTFLIDRDGKIAAVGLRGAAQIEQALKNVL